jgi:hypothetical protein
MVRYEEQAMKGDYLGHVSRASCAALALGAVLACAACEQSSDVAVENPVAPGPFVGRLSSTVTTVVRTHGCGWHVSPGFDLVVTSMHRNVFLDDVTIHMIDGSNLGGPMVPFPRPTLNSMFSSTRILAGQSRVFIFNPALACSWFTPGAFRADVRVVDEQNVTALFSAVSAP